MYNALHDYQEDKEFERYLLIKDCIVNECSGGIVKILIEKLTKAYQAGEDLMLVLQGTKGN
ncbi:MAG: hypothetical protein WC875_03840 [Candidatus Absconditabacterales bacterium]